MKTKKRIIIAVTLMIIFLVIWVAQEQVRNRASISDMKSTMEKLSDLYKDMEISYDDLIPTKIDNNEANVFLQKLDNKFFFTKSDIKQLEDFKDGLFKNIELIIDPVEFKAQKVSEIGEDNYRKIEENLRELGAEFIGYKGVLGGTMFFENILILTDSYAYGQFSDGHIAGSGLYEYTTDSEGKIKWTIVMEVLQ